MMPVSVYAGEDLLGQGMPGAFGTPVTPLGVRILLGTLWSSSLLSGPCPPPLPQDCPHFSASVPQRGLGSSHPGPLPEGLSHRGDSPDDLPP